MLRNITNKLFILTIFLIFLLPTVSSFAIPQNNKDVLYPNEEDTRVRRIFIF